MSNTTAEDRNSHRMACWQSWVASGIEKKFSVEEHTDFGDVTLADGVTNVESLTHNGEIIVDASDASLFRRVVVTRPDGSYHIVGELMSESAAAALVSIYNTTANPDEKAESIGYVEAYERAFALEISEGRRDRDWALDDAERAERAKDNELDVCKI